MACAHTRFDLGIWWGWKELNLLDFRSTDLQSAATRHRCRIPVAGMDQYRQLLDDVDVDDELLVWVTGVEPAASRSQSARSTI